MIACSLAHPTLIQLTTENKKKEKEVSEVNLTDFMDIKGWKAVGNRLSFDLVKKVQLISPCDGAPEVIEEPIVEDLSEDTDDQNDSTDDQNGHLPEPPDAGLSDNGQLNLL